MMALLRADESYASKHHDGQKESSTVSTSDDVSDREELHTAFHVFDANSDGFIDASELRSAMHELTGDNLTDADVSAMIHSADRDGDGLINYEGNVRPLTHTPETGLRNQHHKFEARFRRQFFVPMHDF